MLAKCDGIVCWRERKEFGVLLFVPRLGDEFRSERVYVCAASFSGCLTSLCKHLCFQFFRLIFVSYVWQQSFLATCSMYWFALYCNFNAFSNCVCCQQYMDVCQCIQQSPNIHQVANWILAIEQRDLLEALFCVLLLFLKDFLKELLKFINSRLVFIYLLLPVKVKTCWCCIFDQ